MPNVSIYEMRFSYEIRGDIVFTDHVRSAREGNVFTRVCDSVLGGRGGEVGLSPRDDPTSSPTRQQGDPTLFPAQIRTTPLPLG